MVEQKVASVERALSILEAFSDGTSRLSLAELSVRTGFYRSTILRLTDSLRRFGYMHRDADGNFSLGPALWRLGALYQNAFDLADYIRPVLDELVESTGETAAFYVRQGAKRLCLFRHISSSPLRFHIDEGSELPMGREADSRVLMAFSGEMEAPYNEVRERGFHVNLGENNPKTGGVAAPVFGSGGRFVGALGIAGFRDHFEGKNGERIISVVIERARNLSRTLDGR